MPTPALATTRTPVPVPQPAATPARRVGTSTVEPRIATAGPPVVRLRRMTTPVPRSVIPRADTSRPSRTSPVAQPANSVMSAQPSTGRTEQRPPGMGSSTFDALQVVNDRARQNSGASSTFLGRIAAAPRSPVQAEALTQAQLINDDCARSEAQVSRIAAARRQQISTYFSGARQGLSDFFTRSVTTIQTFIAGKQAEIIGAVTRALAWVRTAITNTLQAAQTIAGQIRARINQMLENISTSMQSRVEGIAGQITGLIDSIPLPDIPGIGRIRAAAVSLLNRAAGIVNGAFSRLVDFVGWAFNTGMDLLDSILSTITGLVDTALSLASSAILSVLQMIGQALNQAVALIGATLRSALLAVIIPILNSVESLIAKLIGSAEQSALGLLRRNRNEYLSSLVEAVTPGAAPQGSQAASTESQIAVLRRLGRDAAQNSQMIVQVFDALTSGNLASIIRTLASAAARTVVGIAALLAQMIRAIVTAVTQALQILTQVAQTIGNFLRELIQSFIAWVGNLVEYVRSLVQRGADQLIRFAQNGLSRIGSFIRRFVQNLILGRGLSDSLTDALGEFNLTQTFSPTPVSFLGPAPAFVGAPPAFLIVIIAGVVYITILGLSFTLPLWAAIVIAVLLVLLLLLLLYLLYRWLTKPKPPKKRVIRVDPSVLELGVGGRDINSVATIAPGTPPSPPLTWTINPGGTSPAGVSVIGSSQTVKVHASHPPHGTVVGGTPITVRAALTANPADFADSAPVMMVQVVSANYAAVPPLVLVPSFVPGTPPPNSAEPNRDGISGNTAVVNAVTAPAGRPVTITFRRSLGASVSGTVITPGSDTGDIGLRITDTATDARLDETQPSTSGPAALMADVTVNAVPLRVSALTHLGPRGPYGVANLVSFAPSDSLHLPMTRIVGELITDGGDQFNLPQPNLRRAGGFNNSFHLRLAVPANRWADELTTPPLVPNVADNLPAIDVNRFVGPGVPQLPRSVIYRQRFQYSSWQGAGTVISQTLDDGRHIRSLIGSPPARFQFKTEQIFSMAAPPHVESYRGRGPDLIELSNMRATPNPVPAGTANATVTVNVTPTGRTINWSVDVAGVTVTPNVTTGPNPMAVTVTRPAGFTGSVIVTATDSVFAARTNRLRIIFR